MASILGVGDFIGWDGGCLLIGKATGVIPRHSHQAIQIVFGDDGPTLLREGDAGEWTGYPLAVIPSRQPHSMDATGSTFIAVMLLEPETVGGRSLTERHLLDGIASLDDARVREAAAELFEIWLSRADEDVLIQAAQRVVQQLTGADAPTEVTDKRILKAIEYINANLAGAITLEAVARAVFLSPGRFRHLFVEQTGMGLRPYVLWRRFLRAWGILASGASVATAAHGAGFADQAHFARTSRQSFGFPPSMLQVDAGPPKAN